MGKNKKLQTNGNLKFLRYKEQTINNMVVVDGIRVNLDELNKVCKFLQNHISKYHFDMLVDLINRSDTSRKVLTQRIKDFSL